MPLGCTTTVNLYSSSAISWLGGVTRTVTSLVLPGWSLNSSPITSTVHPLRESLVRTSTSSSTFPWFVTNSVNSALSGHEDSMAVLLSMSTWRS